MSIEVLDISTPYSNPQKDLKSLRRVDALWSDPSRLDVVIFHMKELFRKILGKS